MLYLDTETCGLTGPIVTIQYADGDGDVQIWHVWENPASCTRDLIHWICETDVCGFNLTYDWFHINKLYNLLTNVNGIPQPEKLPEPSDYCLKPRGALDLMLVARSGPYQATMERKPVIIRKVPRQIMYTLADHLSHTIRAHIPQIYFSRKPSTTPFWQIVENHGYDFVDLKLRFYASGSLKAIVKDLGRERKVPAFSLIQPHDEEWNPHGNHWLPYIRRHIKYWKENKDAQIYATEDVDDLRFLYDKFNHPPVNDINSQLAILVGCCRNRGFALDLNKIPPLQEQAKITREAAPRAPAEARAFIEKESIIDIKDTSKATLERLENEGVRAAGLVSRARQADKKLDLFRKLQHVRRFHPSFKIIGTRSGRMSGGSFKGRKSINPQGIQRDKEIRSIFTLKDNVLPYLCGGDFEGFEVTIQDANWKSAKLRRDLESGRKIYDIFGEMLPLDVDEDEPSYHKRKTGFLGWSYGSHEEKLAEVLGVSIDTARGGLENLNKKYPEIQKHRDSISERFLSMSQPAGLGTEVIWKDPDDYIETLFGFKRYFSLENKLCKLLYGTATKLPRGITSAQGTVKRTLRRGTQTVAGATRSSLYAAAFQIQSGNVRQANNHVIQGTGAEICKRLQVRLWGLQPIGIHPWRIACFNIHDEVMCTVRDQETAEETKRIAEEIVEEHKQYVPLLELTWKTGLESWGDK